MNPLPDSSMNLSNFDEIAYSVENFTKEKKIRDIGFVGVDAFKVGRFFSMLPRKYSQINIGSVKTEINNQIKQIENARLSDVKNYKFYALDKRTSNI